MRNIDSGRNTYYRVHANIDLGAIGHNLQVIKNNLSEKTLLMAVIKADAYGHGAEEIAHFVDDKNLIDYYGVAILDEATDLRESGITKPILILGFTPTEQFEIVVANDIAQTVFDYDAAVALSKEGERQGKLAKIHIKIDTGMSRIGFADTPENMELIQEIATLPNLMIEGIFSHLARADEYDHSNALHQMERFANFVSGIEARGIDIPLKHIANSAGMIGFPQAHYNMVRAGIVIYGVYPSDEVERDNLDIQPAMELKTHVVFLKEVEAGVPVSYGGTYVTTKKTKIATIPIGYADGYSRNISNCGKVLVNGQYAPVIGRVCMDQFMVDVTGIEKVQVGDVVTLLGRDHENSITVENLACWSHKLSYELVCTVGKRVPRFYMNK